MIEFLKNWWFLIMMLGFASIINFIWLFYNKNKLNFKWYEILIVDITHVLFGVFTVWFFAKLEAGFNAKIAGNMSLYGGIFLMPIFYFVLAKIKKIKISFVFDVFTFCLINSLIFARFNCLYAGCCRGIQIGNEGFLFPQREIEIALNILFNLIIIYLVSKKKNNGLIYPLYMIYYSLIRTVLEFFREGELLYGVVHAGHVWSIVSFVIGGLIILSISWYKSKYEKKCF